MPGVLDIAGLFGRLYGGVDPRFSPQDRNALGRSSLTQFLQGLMSDPTTIGGISGGLNRSFGAYQTGAKQLSSEYDKREEDRLDRMIKSQTYNNSVAEAGYAKSREARAVEDFSLDKKYRQSAEERAVSAESRAKSAEERASADQSMQTEEHKLNIENLQRTLALKKRQETALSTLPQMFARNANEMAIYTAMLQSGQYSELVNTIKEQRLPKPRAAQDSWSDPYSAPGIGFVQRNLQDNSIRVLQSQPNEDGVRFRPNPQQINKLKIDILTKELIPDYLAKQREVNSFDWHHPIDSIFGGEDQPDEEMTQYQGFGDIPTRLLQEAENEASRRYVDAYKKAWSDFDGRTIGKGKKEVAKVDSLQGGPVKGNPVQDFSAQIALDKALRARIEATSSYLDEDSKQQIVDEMRKQVMDQIHSGQITLDEVIKQLEGQQ